LNRVLIPTVKSEIDATGLGYDRLETLYKNALRCIFYALVAWSMIFTFPSKGEIYKSVSECVSKLSSEGSDMETVQAICNTITIDSDKKENQEALIK
jgi:hypothetical protein